jgi:hypothetical protein
MSTPYLGVPCESFWKSKDIFTKVAFSTAEAGFSMVWVIIDLPIVKSRVQGHTESLRIIVSTLFAIRLSFAIGLASRHRTILNACSFIERIALRSRLSFFSFDCVLSLAD